MESSQFLNDRTWKQLLFFVFFAWCCCMLFLCLRVRSITWENFPYSGRLDCHEARDILRMILWSRDALSTWYCWWKKSCTSCLAYYLQGFIHHRWCRISSINSKLWHLLRQCVSTSCVSRLSTLLPLGLWHSARPVVYGIVGRVSRTPTAIVLSRTCPDHVSKSAIWQSRQEIVQHVQHVPKHVQLHTLNSQAFHAAWKHETNDIAWWLVACFVQWSQEELRK